MAVWNRISIAILITGMTVLPLSACGQSNPETYAYAKKLFDAHRPQFEQLVKLISDCKYAGQIQGGGPQANLPNVPEMNVCTNHKIGYRNHIAAGLGKLNILWVTIGWLGQAGSSDRQFDGVSFVLSSHGLMVGPSHGSAIWYFVKPQTNIDGSKPLTSLPSRWWFNYSVSK